MPNLKTLKAQALKLPHLPGVYQYRNDQNEIIYIGKAKDLHKRVNSYFKQNHDLIKTNILVNQVARIEYTVTPTEIDALTLEAQLINQHRPKYNILLKNDHSCYYICLTKSNPPQISTSRRPLKNQFCFGPFPFATSKIVTIARDILGLTKAQKINHLDWQIYLDASNFDKNRNQLNLDQKTYQTFIDKLVKTIKYGDQDLIKQYQKYMQMHAEKMEFEQALQYRNKINLLEKLAQRTSKIANTKTGSTHLIVCLEQNKKLLLFLFNIQNGLLHYLTDFKFELTNLEDILNAFLKQYYTNNFPPKQIAIYYQTAQTDYLINLDPLISDFLNLTWPVKPQIELVKKHKLLDLALQNIAAKLNLKTNLNYKLQLLLNLDQPPTIIDFIDISNLSDQIVVGGIIRFINGEAVKNLWRHYNIKTFQGQDDYASMREVISRHYLKVNPVNHESSILPNVLIIDGGLGQLNTVLAILPKDCPVTCIGLAKANELLIFKNQATKALSLSKTADRFIIKGRDSVHNFVINHTRTIFKKFYKKSELDLITGIGPSTKLKLLLHFKSVSQIKSASLITLINLIGQHKAQIIYNFFHHPKP